MALGHKFPKEADMSDKLHPIATEVIFEDERVRVWNQVVPAGGEIKRHRHDHDYYLINVSGAGPIEVLFHDSTGGEQGESVTFSPKPGSANYVKKGHVETAINHGDEYRAILVEFKQEI